ncbi:MAG: DUF4292 domain-containing protein, partial [Bacteroidaceae bacterium]|nr:DUF4292 domain-containing protein [Bacteroidaceae bacterium]
GQSTASSSLSTEAAASQYKQRVAENSVKSEHMTARISMDINLGQKDLSVNGTLRMKRNDVVQISLVALGLLEVGRLELTPEYLLVLDRMNNRYVKKTYDEVDFFRTSGIDFYTFQSLFWNELFLFGDKGEAPSESDFKAAQQDDRILLLNDYSDRMLLTFVVDAQDALVGHTRVSPLSGTDNKVMDWTYSNFRKFEEGMFPGKMEMAFHFTSKPITLSLMLNNLKQSDGWETRTRLNDKYQEIPLDLILNKIMTLSE